jgi:hypothetical protein
MKKNYLTLVLLLTVLAAPALKSFAMVPPPESLRKSKHVEQGKVSNPDTTVIATDKFAVFLPTHPSVAVFLPTHPSLAVFLPTHPSVAVFLPTHPSLAVFLPTHPSVA